MRKTHINELKRQMVLKTYSKELNRYRRSKCKYKTYAYAFCKNELHKDVIKEL